VVVGLLGLGVAASTRPDPQAKGLGEYLRSRHVHIPVRLLDGSQAGGQSAGGQPGGQSAGAAAGTPRQGQ
jgi:hypothetical protein